MIVDCPQPLKVYYRKSFKKSGKGGSNLRNSGDNKEVGDSGERTAGMISWKGMINWLFC